jgi:hypothetical protein
MSDEADFQKFRPALTEETINGVAQTYGSGAEIISLSGKRTGLDLFVLLLANDTEPHGPFLMNATCARELCALLLSEGFGPQEA